MGIPLPHPDGTHHKNGRDTTPSPGWTHHKNGGDPTPSPGVDSPQEAFGLAWNAIATKDIDSRAAIRQDEGSYKQQERQGPAPSRKPAKRTYAPNRSSGAISNTATTWSRRLPEEEAHGRDHLGPSPKTSLVGNSARRIKAPALRCGSMTLVP